MRFAVNKILYLLLAFIVVAILIAILLSPGRAALPGSQPADPFLSFESLRIVLLVILLVMLFTTLIAVKQIRASGRTALTSQENSGNDAGETSRIEDVYHEMIAEVEDYAIILLDSQGNIQNWNKGAQKIKGYEAREVIGKNFSLFYTRQDRDSGLPEKNLAEAREMGKAVYEGWRVRKDGNTLWGTIVMTSLHNDRGEVTGFTKITRDITEKRKAEEKFHSLLDSAPDATVIVNEQGLIQMTNTQTEKLFGYTRDQLLGKPVEILIPTELRNKHVHHRADFAKSSKVRAMGVGIELNAVKRDGSMFPVEISLSPIQTEEGMLISASVRDISHRKALENELKKTNTELEAFTYSVSHDLRAPLRGIIGFTSVLEEEYSDKLDAEAKRITTIIKDNTIKMGRLIDDLLSFSRTGRQEINKTDINTSAMVHEIMEELTDQSKADQIKWDIRKLLPLKGDISTIRQVWINLLSNAIKYTGNKMNPHIEIGSWTEKGYTVCYVKDNGVGFDELYKDKLFKVFQRLHDVGDFDGTGVGLALVEKIVSKHGGRVWAEGKINEGATFYFALPV